MLFGNFETIVSYFADAAVKTLVYGLVDDEALPLNMIRAIMDNNWGDVKIEFKWKPETFSHCSSQYRRQVNAGRFIIEEKFDARLALFAFLEKNGLEVPCPFEAFIRKTEINVNDYFSHNMKKFGYWGMMSLALSRFEFSNDKFTVYLAVPPFIPKTSTSGDSFFPDHLFLFGLEQYSSEVYNDQLKTVLGQTENFLHGQGSFDKELILSNCGRVLQRQTRSHPLQINIMPMPYTTSTSSHKTSSVYNSSAETPSPSTSFTSGSSTSPVSLPPSSLTEQTQRSKPLKGTKNQAERSRARKLKRRQLKEANFSNQENKPSPKKKSQAENEIPKVTEACEPEKSETTESKMKCQPKKRPKTHFRKTKKPGRV